MDCVSIDRQPPLRMVRLDNGKRNIMTLEAVEALAKAIEPDDEAPVVVLSGRTDGFCAGLDNKTLAGPAVAREELLARMGQLLSSALRGPTRIVAACEGHAVAAGAMLLLVSDLRLGVPGDYKVGFTEPRMGMPLPELPALLAHQRLDRRRLHELGVLGRIVGPEEAAEAGFLDRLVGGGSLMDDAMAVGREIAGLSDGAYRGSLKAVWGDSLARIEELAQAQVKRSEAARQREA